jgi:O-glycosyl hydrolase
MSSESVVEQFGAQLPKAQAKQSVNTAKSMFPINCQRLRQSVKGRGATKLGSGVSSLRRAKRQIGSVLVVCIQTLKEFTIFRMEARLWLAT